MTEYKLKHFLIMQQ